MTAFNPACLPHEERRHWMKRRDWPAGFTRHSAAFVMAFLWLFSAVWCGLTALIFRANGAKIEAAMDAGLTGWIVPVLVVLVGAIAVISAICTTISWLRFGSTTLRIDTLPSFVGESFRGRLEAGDYLLGRRRFTMTLTCEEVIRQAAPARRRNRKKQSHVVRRQAGSASRTIDRLPIPDGMGRSVLKLDIDVPEGLPGSLHRDDGTGYQWILSVTTSDGHEPAFSAAFEIPVYRREELLAA